MCYILRCADNSFFIIDGGHFLQPNDHKRIYRFLRERTPDGVLRDIETYVLAREDADRFAADPRHAADGFCDAAGENIGRAELLARGYNNG